ncbi:MAG: hypothetical protein KHZ65_17430 [Phocaeicola vulgatus]|nr:hypothetical protein [Phocaeicola vulgatus]
MKQTDRLALLDWEKYKEDIARATPVDRNMTAAEREKHREYLEKHPIEWIKFFFPNYVKYEFADFQKKAIRRIIAHDEWFEVLSWSRELAKSTVTMFIVMNLTLTGRKKNVILTSNSKDNAVRLLDPYRANLEANGRIMAYYGKQELPGSWTEDEFTTKGKVSFRALVIFCGNIIAKDCCVVRAGEMADSWDIVNIRDKNGFSTWPEKNSEEDIDRTLSKISKKAAQGEYFNNPISVGEVFENIAYGKVPALSKFKFLVVYGDPAPGESKGKKGKSFKTVSLCGKLGGRLYVIKTFLAQALNAEFIDWYVRMLEFVGGKTNVYCYMENNKLQDPFFQQVFKPLVAKVRREQKIALFIRGDEEKKTDKATRIEANLEPLNREGNLILNEAERDNPHMKELEDQFKLFTLTMRYPADGPDAVEGANRIIDELIRRIEPPVFRSRKDVRKRNKKRL